MPELGMPKNEFIKKVREVVHEKCCNLWPDEIQKIADENNQEVIGSGAECVVIPGKDNSKDIVVAYTYFDLNPLKAKQLFYSQRIFSTLFPHNFPHFYAAFGKHPNQKQTENPSGTIRQMIHEDKKQKVVYSFAEVDKICKELGLPLLIERGSQNFATGEDGGEYYLDTIEHLYPPQVDKNKVISYMTENNFSSSDISMVEKCFSRLEEVYKQAEVENTERKKILSEKK